MTRIKRVHRAGLSNGSPESRPGALLYALQTHSRVWDGLIFSRRGSPEQHATGINPIIIRAFYSAGAHHPHLQGGTLGDWPLNVFDEKQAAAELPTLRSIASADIHNLVFQRDYRIIPAIVSGRPP
jgi:hypothetical protein